ncbi:52 kDa repressor of the inhibitor of the protein kinase-like [Hydra vulgaris]|uniref:52 kDa repressor of the inhibitor of the protein kinase-like n=1 Tax=Hydra vulgaris TaxID=6087 RepID=A0ABM4BA35_HYDVU
MFTDKYNTNQEPPISTIADKSFLYEPNNNKFITSSHRNSVFERFIDSKSCFFNTLLPLNKNDCRLNIAFRGHRDNSQHHPTVGKYSLVNGVGNFVELLNYRIRGEDKVLEHHLNSCAKNASYISNSSQNELINYCGKYIQNILISDIKENQFFSIIAVEASDCSNQEQMSLIIRFIDSSFDVREEVMGFLHCKYGLSGEALCKTILLCLKDYSLDISNCRGQGYDGAGSVVGHIKGLAKRIKDYNDKAVYTHCFSHRLNLSVANSCKLQEVRNMMEQVKQLSYFFNFSESRQNLLEAAITKYYPSATKKKLIDACPTRWVERITGLDDFKSLFVPIVFCLEGMSMNLEKMCNKET